MEDGEAKTKQQQDFDDLEAERAGRNNNRIDRFFSDSERFTPNGEKKQDSHALELFRAQHEMAVARLRSQLNTYDQAAQMALEEATKRETAALENLDRLRDAATRTGDGTLVYFTADGSRAFDDQGNELTPDELAGIEPAPDAPTWEERQQAGERLEQAIEQRQDVEDYQDRLRESRERLNGDLSADELDGIKSDLENMPPSVRLHLRGIRTPAITAATERDGSAIEADRINPKFQRASFHIEPVEAAQAEKTTAPALTPVDF